MGDEVTLTNNRWKFSIVALCKQLGFDHLSVILGFILGFWLVARMLRQHLRPSVSLAWLMSQSSRRFKVIGLARGLPATRLTASVSIGRPVTR